MLANERQLVHDLMRENTELKLRIKDLETAAATGPIPKQGQKTSKPPLSTVQSQGSNEKKDSVSPLCHDMLRPLLFPTLRYLGPLGL